MDEIQTAVKLNPIVPLTLCCNTDTVYQYQNPGREFDTPEGADYNDLRDLSVHTGSSAPFLGLPGPPWTSSTVFPPAIPACSSVCAYPSAEAPGWPSCRFAATGNYERGLTQDWGQP